MYLELADLLYCFHSLFLLPDDVIDPKAQIGLAQSCLVPVSLCATIGNAVFDTVDIGWALILSAALSLGIPIGARIMANMNPQKVKIVVATVLLAVSIITFSWYAAS